MPTAKAPLPPNGNRGTGVFLPNALLWLKRDGMQSHTPAAWFDRDAATRLRDQIALVRPRVVVGLGSRRIAACCARTASRTRKGCSGRSSRRPAARCSVARRRARGSSGVYHCGAKVQHITRPLAEQHRDWARVAVALGTV
jgi:hypothetical protein